MWFELFDRSNRTTDVPCASKNGPSNESANEDVLGFVSWWQQDNNSNLFFLNVLYTNTR